MLSSVLLWAGCAGSLSPLYADFRIDEPPPDTSSVSVPEPGLSDSTRAEPDLAMSDSTTGIPYAAPGQTIQQRIADALVEAGWELDEAPSDNAVSTKEIEIVEWGLYDVRVSLDVVPINDTFVRVYVHPYRQYFYGSRSKMSYMNRRVREYVFPELAEAFGARGIVPVGAPSTADSEKDAENEDAQEAISASRDLSPR